MSANAPRHVTLARPARANSRGEAKNVRLNMVLNADMLGNPHAIATAVIEFVEPVASIARAC